MPEYLSTDPNAGTPTRDGYLSIDPRAGSQPPTRTREPGLATIGEMNPTFRSTNERDARGQATVRPEDNGFSFGEFVSEGTQGINPINWAKALGSAVSDPVGVARAMYEGRSNLSNEARTAFERGDYVTGTAKTIYWLIPFLGERLSQAADYMQAGEWDKGLGATLDVTGQVVAPTALGGSTVRNTAVRTPRPLRNANPVEQAAVEFGAREGIPVDAATASGNRFVRGTQRIADETILGSGNAARANQAQGQAFETTGQRLMDRTSPSAVTAEQAGDAVRAGVTNTAKQFGSDANAAYDALRAIEKNNPGIRVGLQQVKTQLKPLYQRLLRESQLVPLQGDKGRALTALDRLMNGPDSGWLSDVDAALGDLKALARADIPELRTQGQGIAAQAVKELNAAVDATAARMGPDAVRALREGRAATVSKHAAVEILESLRAEPVGIYRQVTAPRDAAVGLLRDLHKLAPNELPKVGRAVLEDLLTRAMKEGGFARAQGLQAEWLKLGSETKKLLYRDADLIKDLDNFFLLAKKAAENPNPSGTALTLQKSGELGLLYTDPVTGAAMSISALALSKMLHSPRLVKLLNRGLMIPVKSKAASTAVVGELLTAAREAHVHLAPAADREDRVGPAAPSR